MHHQHPSYQRSTLVLILASRLFTMVKLSVALLASLAACASAFAPQKAAVQDSTLAASKVPEWKLYEDGEVWDPLNLAKLSDGQAFDTFPNCFPNQQFVKEAEIKHGRMAMLAWTGVWATSTVRMVV